MRFTLRVFDSASGAVRIQWLEAASELEAQELARSRGLQILSLQAQRSSLGWLRWKRTARLDVADWCQQLARLLRAGMSLPEALEAQALRLAESGDSGLAQLYEKLRLSLLEGRRLSAALRNAGSFPEMLIAAIQASERSGRVASALEEYARHESAMRDLRRKIVNASIYPTLVIGFGSFVALFLLGYVVPRFAKVFTDTRAQVSLPTRFILRIGNAVQHHGLLIATGIAALVALLVWMAGNAQVRTALARWVERIGPIRRWVRDLQLARISQSMAMLLANGFTVPEAMRLAGPQAMRPDLREAMRQATSMIETGETTSGAWRRAGVAQAFATRVLQAGERTGDLAACFDSLAQTYRIQVETQLERASRLAEPILLLLVASLIGTIVVMMYLPIVDLATAAG